MYGVRKLLVCGYSEPEQQVLLSLINGSKLIPVPVIFAITGDEQRALKEVLESDDGYGLGEVSDMKRAIIMSGFTQKELHFLMTDYRKAKLPTQLWATLTPISEKWSVTDLLEELAAEGEALKKQRK